MAGLQERDLPGRQVGGGDLKTVALMLLEQRKLGAGMRPFPPDDDPHVRGPAGPRPDRCAAARSVRRPPLSRGSPAASTAGDHTPAGSAVDRFTPLPRDHGRLAALDGSYGYLRQFTPQALDAVRFAAGTAAAELLAAVEILRDLNATSARKVPDDAPTGFVPARWRGYLDTAAKAGNTSAYRHYWELCMLMALRDGLRTGDVFVPGSRRYSGPAAYLLTPRTWADQRGEFCRLVGKPADPDAALSQVTEELHTALGDLEQTLSHPPPGGGLDTHRPRRTRRLGTRGGRRRDRCCGAGEQCVDEPPTSPGTGGFR